MGFWILDFGFSIGCGWTVVEARQCLNELRSEPGARWKARLSEAFPGSATTAMNRLWLQLTLGFALVALVSIVTVAALAHARARDTFRGYLAQSQALESGLVERLAEHYATYGSWEGVEALLARGPGAAQRPGRGVGGPPWSGMVLTDAAGRVVADTGGLAARPALSARELAEAIPIVVNGQVAGYLVARTPGAAALPPAAQRFLESLNGAFWMAGPWREGWGWRWAC